MKVFKAKVFEGATPCIFDKIDNAIDFLAYEVGSGDELEVGELISIEVAEISEEKFKNLPEWDGP
jgi:hypothetical protein